MISRNQIVDYICGRELPEEVIAEIEAMDADPDSLLWQVARQMADKTRLAFDPDAEFGWDWTEEDEVTEPAGASKADRRVLGTEEEGEDKSDEMPVRRSEREELAATKNGIFGRRMQVALGTAVAILILAGAGTWVAISSFPKLTTSLRDRGAVVGIDRDGSLVGLEEAPSDLQDDVKVLLVAQRFDLPSSFSELQAHRGGAGDRKAYASLVSPVNTAVMTHMPTFDWKEPREDVASYTVLVYDGDGTETSEPVIQSEAVSETQWTVAVPVIRGRVYSWKIRALLRDVRELYSPKPGMPLPRFRVLPAEEVAEIERKRDGLLESNLVRSVLYAKAGLLDDAEREVKELAAKNAESPIPGKMLDRLREVRYGSE